MKIDNSITTPNLAATSRAKPAQGTAPQAAAASGEVKLSSLADRFLAGETEAPFDSARVAEIKQAIAEGRFSVNANAIADRLLDTARDLIGSQRRA